MSISKATAVWDGTFKTGRGKMTPAHAGDIEFSMGSRFEGAKGSNPEELIGAALAGCFSMALSVGLEKGGFVPKTIHTSADVHLERQDDGFAVTRIALVCEADVPGADRARFQEIADATKKGCPISKALGAVKEITLDARLLER